MNYNSTLQLEKWSITNPEKSAIVFEDRDMSYSELNKRVNASARCLVEYGIEKGDRIAILGMNSDEYVIACLAISRIGAVAVLLNYRLALEELKYLVDDSEPVALMVDSDFLEIAKDLEASINELKLSCILYADTQLDNSLSTLRSQFSDEKVELAYMDQNSLERILYTSGTTSRPKGVMLSHGNSWWNLVTQILAGCNSPDEKTLVFAPLYHIGAQELPGMRIFGVGGQMVVMRRFDAESVLKAVSTYSITGMVMVSTMVHIMRDLPNRLSFDTSSLTWLVFGQVPENMLEDIRAIFPNASLKNSYGLTESCSTVTTIDDAYQRRYPTSPGRVVPCLDLRIVDENGNEVSRGELGEVVVKGPKTMLGYWRNPLATAEVLQDGWLYTGDVGYLDTNDLLYVVDRKKDMIRTGGENVASQEVERVIYELEWVAEVAVVGVRDEKWGERIRAVVVPREGVTPSQEQIVQHCKEKLASFKVPKEVLFRSELPRNPSGKVLKRDLR